MRAAVLTDYGKPLEIQEIPVPEPGPGEVLVRVAGAGLCHSDLHLSTGELPMLPSFPWVLGHEVAGYVEAYGPLASGVSSSGRLEHGTPVAVFGGWGCGRCTVCHSGEEQLCSTTSWVVKKVLPRLVPGTTAVVIGAGGLGQYAIQALRELSAARVVVVEASEAHRGTAESLGADLVVGPDDVAAAGLDGSAAAVLDVVGSDATLAMAGRLAAPRGEIVVIGLAGGTLPVGFLSPAAEVVVSSSYWGSRNELAEVIALAQRGRLRSHVHEVDLAGADNALRDLEAGRVDGRVVLVP